LEAPYIIEACVDSLESAVLAEQNGADQIELCTKLDVGGLTPDFTLIKQVQKILNIPIKAIVRPREGNFVYNDDEVEHMIDSISKCRYLGIKGVVFGTLTPDNQDLDMELVEELSAVAYPLEVTIHKAIDECTNPVKEIKKLKKIKNISSVLSSGTKNTALEGAEVLKSMIREGGERIKVIAAGKITKENLSIVRSKIGAKAYHGRAIV